MFSLSKKTYLVYQAENKCSKRVFILGPSHHAYLDGCAVTKCTVYATPLGNLTIDTDGIALFRNGFTVTYTDSFDVIRWRSIVIDT